MGSLKTQKRLVDQCRKSDQTQQSFSSEVFADVVTDAGVMGFVLASLPRKVAPILWVQDHLSRKETGAPYLPGIGIKRPIIQVTVSRAADALFAIEEGLRCHSLTAVMGEIWGDPPALDFTATKRLSMRAEAARMPCWLIRRAASADLSAARDRWRVKSLPSAPHPQDIHAPGAPRWQVTLFRSRNRSPGTWVASYDGTADRFNLAAPFRDGEVAARDGATGQRAAG
ncbi:hypothetical protein QTO30_12035 [Yoonia sp. GPGPB17]|uniref:ImuA family protein n=1 Tax=Yoonia sp. GPGPB17 TaxID=3026147 RepID=UPI0030BF0604